MNFEILETNVGGYFEQYPDLADIALSTGLFTNDGYEMYMKKTVTDVNTLMTLKDVAVVLEGEMFCRTESDKYFGIIFWNEFMFVAPTKIVIDDDNMEIVEDPSDVTSFF